MFSETGGKTVAINKWREGSVRKAEECWKIGLVIHKTGERDEGEGNGLQETPKAQLCLQMNLPVCKSYGLLLWSLET